MGHDRRAKVSDKPATEKPAFSTKTLPDELRGAWLEGPDVVTGLQVVGTSLQFELPRHARSFRLGSSAECDIVLPYPYLSRVHCVLEQRPTGLRVHDHGSKNGIVFRNRIEHTIDVRPGETFVLGSVSLIALNDEMRSAFPVLTQVVGAEDEPRGVGSTKLGPSKLVQLATLGHHLLITGEPGCDQERLAATLHAISLVRRQPLVQIERVPADDRVKQREIIDRASRSTLVITIDKSAPAMDGAFVSMIFSASYRIRVIAIAPHKSKAREVLGDECLTTMSEIAVRPLVERAGAIPGLLDACFAELRSPLRVSDMTTKNRDALRGASWPHNFDDLRSVAERLVVIAREHHLRPAAKALNMSKSALHRWCIEHGLDIPLLEGESADERDDAEA